MSMCRVFSCVVGRGYLPWPVHSLDKTLLAFALFHFVLQGQILPVTPGSSWIPTLALQSRMEIPDHRTCLLRNLYADQEAIVRPGHGTNVQTGTKLGKEYIKAIYCHLSYVIYMQSSSHKILGWMKHKLESRLPGEILVTSDTQMIPPLWQKAKN